jgi:F-type H+-transporting ATPase subunit delta
LKAVADRYAEALLEVALARNVAEQVKEAVDQLGAIIDESADLRLCLANPAVPRDKKSAVMEMLLARMEVAPELRQILRNFVLVVADHRRGALLPEIAVSYTQRLNTKMGIVVADVASAAQLSDTEQSQLEKAFAIVTDMKIAATYEVNSDLVGGAVVKIGSVIYDGSVKEQLRRMQEKLAG